MTTIPQIQQIPGPKFTITPAADGLSFALGNVDADNMAVGGLAVHFVMDSEWNGTISMLGRASVHKAGVDDIAFVGPWPFRAFYLNAQPADGSMMSGASAIITDTSSILVPGPGQTIGMNVACASGSCTMYYVPVLGTTIP